VIRVEGLRKNFGKASNAVGAVSGVSFEVPAGSLVSLLGPSGCGKTTTLRMIAGLERPTAGRLVIDGELAFGDAENVFVPVNRRAIGMVFQSYAIWPHMTVEQNVGYPLRVVRPRLPKSEQKERVAEALDLVGLGAYAARSATALSGGQQQRVALARALVRRPKILLLDEPLSNLDAELRDRMRDEIRQLQQQLGITTVFVTHDQAEALAISDQVIVMDQGRLVESGTPEEVYRRPTSHVTARFLGLSNRLRGEVVAVGEGTVRVRLGDSTLEVATPVAVPTGSPTVVAIRPSGLRIDRRRISADSWPGTVERGIFRGDAWDYAVKLGAATVFVRSYDLDARLQPGEAVFVEARPGAAILVEDLVADESRG
jgi:iron(III) transport system ATP-binding protein